MGVLRARPDPRLPDACRQATSRLAAHALLALALTVAPIPQALATSTDDTLILTLSSNGMRRGEFTLVRRPDGDFWVSAEDVARLGVRVDPAARRASGAEAYYSLRALGATRADFDEANLHLDVLFAPGAFEGTQIDLATRPHSGDVTAAPRSLILAYRLNLQGSGSTRSASLENSLNVRVGKVLLRQETRLLSLPQARGWVRGVTQLVWDEPALATRFAAGDVFSTAGPFGSAITGAGVLIQRVYDMKPDLIRHPTFGVRTVTTLPADVVIDVDGTPVFRGTVPPGPIDISNLLQYGGLRNVRVTVTDSAGRREVIERPFFFTNTVLAHGLHEFSYFAGRRSELAPDFRWRYGQPAWQAYHRVGVTDAVTAGAGGEGSRDFTNLGAGLALRADRLGVASLEALASRNRLRGLFARGWAARYSHVLGASSIFLGRRAYDDGFTSFATGPLTPFLRSETSVGLSTRLGSYNLTAQWSRSLDERGPRSTTSLRASTEIGRRRSLSFELLQTREPAQRTWAAFLLLRMELDGQIWLSSSLEHGSAGQLLSVEAGRTLPQGEGVGWRAGATTTLNGQHTSLAHANATWNLPRATVDVGASAPLQGGGDPFGQVTVAGALAALDGYWGLTRSVEDSFVVARLGVPQPGVEVSINSQVQGRTDENGMLLIPHVTAFTRQQVAVNDRDLGMQYDLRERQRAVVPAYRSGTYVDFGARAIRAIAGFLWRAGPSGTRTPAANVAVVLSGDAGTVSLETGSAGDFYAENVAVGRYTGKLAIEGRTLECRLEVPRFSEPVFEVPGGITCE